MRFLLFLITFSLLAGLFPAGVSADEAADRAAVKKDLKEAGVEMDRAGKKLGKSIGKAFKELGKETGKAFKELGKEIDEAASEKDPKK